MEVGAPAPALQVDKWLTYSGQSSFAGKPMIIDFWATWCAPCVASFPKLNKLSNTFSDQMHFIAISDENADKVQNFLDKRPLNAVVGVDNGRRTFKNFMVTVLPATYLVDANGILKWYGNPNEIDEEVLRTFIETGDVPLQMHETYAAQNYANENIEEEPVSQGGLFHFNISRCKNPNIIYTKFKDSEIDVRGFNLKDLLLFLKDIPESRAEFVGAFPELELLDINAGSDLLHTDQLTNMVINQLTGFYGINMTEIYLRGNVWVLKVVDPDKLKSFATNNTSEEAEAWWKKEYGRFLATNLELDLLAKDIEAYFDIIVENDLPEGALYNFNIPYFDLEETQKYLEDEMGISMTKEERRTKIVQFERVGTN